MFQPSCGEKRVKCLFWNICTVSAHNLWWAVKWVKQLIKSWYNMARNTHVIPPSHNVIGFVIQSGPNTVWSHPHGQSNRVRVLAGQTASPILLWLFPPHSTNMLKSFPSQQNTFDPTYLSDYYLISFTSLSSLNALFTISVWSSTPPIPSWTFTSPASIPCTPLKRL